MRMHINTKRAYIYALEIMHRIICVFLTLFLDFQYQNKTIEKSIFGTENGEEQLKEIYLVFIHVRC